MSIPEKIVTTGKVYIKYNDQNFVPKLGDILLLLNDDALNPYPGDYENTTSSGYIKAKIYDGLVWQNIDICEFCRERENKFSKRQKAIDSAYLCQSIIEEMIGTIVFKTYRGHYSVEEYEQGSYDRKSSRGRKIKKRPIE